MCCSVVAHAFWRRCIGPVAKVYRSDKEQRENRMELSSNLLLCMSTPFIACLVSSPLAPRHPRFILLVSASAQQGKSGSIVSIGQVHSASTAAGSPHRHRQWIPRRQRVRAGAASARSASYYPVSKRAHERLCAFLLLSLLAAAAAYASAHACLINQINEWGIYILPCRCAHLLIQSAPLLMRSAPLGFS